MASASAGLVEAPKPDQRDQPSLQQSKTAGVKPVPRPSLDGSKPQGKAAPIMAACSQAVPVRTCSAQLYRASTTQSVAASVFRANSTQPTDSAVYRAAAVQQFRNSTQSSNSEQYRQILPKDGAKGGVLEATQYMTSSRPLQVKDYIKVIISVADLVNVFRIQIRGSGFKNTDSDPGDPKKTGSYRIRIRNTG